MCIIMLDYKKIKEYQKCQCGAITITFADGSTNSMSNSTHKKLGIDLRKIRRIAVLTSCCNHCVNHWGIDLCECGSGEKVGKCPCGSNKAVETFGVNFDSFGAMLHNFGMK